MKSLKRRRRFTDKAAHWVITLGGAATIFVILALFVFIFIEVYPLFKGAKVTKHGTFPLRGEAVSIGVDEHQEMAYVIYNNGSIEFIALTNGEVLKSATIGGLKNPSSVLQRKITCAGKDNNRLVLGTDDGRILTASIHFSELFESGKRIISPEISEGETVWSNDKGEGNFCITSKGNENKTVTVVCTKSGKLVLLSEETISTLLGGTETKKIIKDITGLIGIQELENKVEVTAIALDSFAENLYVGTSSGDIFHINVRESENPFLRERVKASDAAITALGFLLGDVSLVVGDNGGGVNTWMQVRDELSPFGWSLKKIHVLESHNAPVTAVATSLRDKGFVTAASNGTIHLNHSTSEQTLLRFETKSPPTAISFSPKANGVFASDRNGILFQWGISNPHPEVTLKILFGSVWYEGYETPEFIWQSTGGTDDFEPKLSLVPLIFGTIKGTLYAMLIAVPIGIFAALYTSQFLHNSLKIIIKPVIEIMAALPSVILGFIAGLWLAPLIERIFPALVVMPFLITLSIVAALFAWKILPVFGKGLYKYGIEALFLIPFVILAVYVSIMLGGSFESLFFRGDYRDWLFNILGLQYDQRNAVVVGFAMGFAIIPLIFTLSEDAMSNVPGSLKSASLALGATPWQTAVRIVLPAASPGIFSAIMIGFGRAVGETMIVLMATGNTPIMDWNLFNGFRALSANIAVEIPEAPFGGTLYRVLFLAALLLFVTTFIVNTVAELVRQKMRVRYSKL